MNAPMPRSYLYVPGDAGRRLELANSKGADAIIADLEDGVAATQKAVARQQVRAWLAQPTAHPKVERWVRLNVGAQGIDDLEQVFGTGLHGVCIPKVADPQDVRRVASELARLEHAHHWAGPGVSIMPLIESADGLLSAVAIARAPRVLRLQLGEVDLAADLGLEPTTDEFEFLNARATVVTASRAAELTPPVGAVQIELRDLASLEQSSWRLRRLGFRARAAIHPSQLQMIHTVFSPSEQDVDEARRLIARYEDARESGVGVLVDEDGRMVDEAVVLRSRSVIALAQDEEGRE